MNAIEIILLLAVIASGAMYYLKIKEVKKLNQEKDDAWMKEKFWQQEYKSVNEKIEKISSQFLNANSELLKCKYDFGALEIEQEKLLGSLQNLQDERDALKSALEFNPVVPEELRFNKPVNPGDFEFEYRGQFNWGWIDITLYDLIGDEKLHGVFLSLLKSNLLPQSIEEAIDYNRVRSEVRIFTQKTDEIGTPITSYTWKQITDQILTKKQIVTDYLHGVIQDSDRAMVVHQALTSKPKKEVSNA